jgi:hypothetical protein
MQALWDVREYIDFEDVILWRDEIGVKKGIVLDDDGKITFTQWPLRIHEEIVSLFNTQITNQFSTPYWATAAFPVLVNTGAEGIYPLLKKVI